MATRAYWVHPKVGPPLHLNLRWPVSGHDCHDSACPSTNRDGQMAVPAWVSLCPSLKITVVLVASSFAFPSPHRTTVTMKFAIVLI